MPALPETTGGGPARAPKGDAQMQPDLELVQLGDTPSFKAWSHGYPFRTVRWHFHPECELHLVAATGGRFFVGDHVGEFAPGQLVLTGPNLPHNWVSDVAPGASVALRSRVLQFSEDYLRGAAAHFPELGTFLPVLAMSRRGVLFSPATAEAVAPLLAELDGASGLRRLELFIAVLGALSRDENRQPLASAAYHPDPSGFMATGLNEALDYIRHHLTESFDERQLAALSRLSPGAFSRSFRRHTGMALSRYVNRLRINLAAQLLMAGDDASVTDICFACGFRNVSNFNRQFLRQKGVPPSRFRSLQTGQALAETAD